MRPVGQSAGLVGRSSAKEVEQYGVRPKRNRFTTDMLDTYCRALGMRPLDEDFYSAPALLLTNTYPPAVESAPPGVRRSLAEAQTYLGFE
jgi:hypothetical protein